MLQNIVIIKIFLCKCAPGVAYTEWSENAGKGIKTYQASGDLLHLWLINSQNSQGWKTEIKEFSNTTLIQAGSMTGGY